MRNVEFEQYWGPDFTGIEIKATRDIKKDEQCVVWYGANFWSGVDKDEEHLAWNYPISAGALERKPAAQGD